MQIRRVRFSKAAGRTRCLIAISYTQGESKSRSISVGLRKCRATILDPGTFARSGASPLARTCGGEEVDQQLVDAFTLVVMHPVRRVGQTLDAVEVRYIIVLGLGEVGAEVGIALAP